MHAAGVQDRTRTDPSQTLPRTVTEAPESSPIVLVSAWLFYGLASLGAVFGLIRIGFWVLSKFKREFSSETREGRLGPYAPSSQRCPLRNPLFQRNPFYVQRNLFPPFPTIGRIRFSRNGVFCACDLK